MSEPNNEELLAVAHLVRPHGVRGEISAIVLAPPVLDPRELLVGRLLLMRTPKGKIQNVTAQAVRPHGERWLVKLQGIDTMDQADILRQCDLCLPRPQLPDLPEGWYWETDLQACRVVDAQLGEIGQAAGLDLTQVQAQLMVERPGGGRVSIPWVRAFIKQVDIAGRQIHTDLPDEYPGLTSSATRA